MITNMRENSLIKEHELIYIFSVFLVFLLMRIVSLIDYNENYKPIDYHLQIISLQAISLQVIYLVIITCEIKKLLINMF